MSERKKRMRVIRTFPDIILKVKTKDVKEITDATIKILEEMEKIVNNANAAGLAANQIGISRSLAVALLENGTFLRMINPQVKVTSGEEREEEGCLSIPNAILSVSRPRKVTIEYLDSSGTLKDFEASGFTARVLQHEIDHLNGKLIFDKLEAEERLKFLREYNK
jgi:peptide deformylase